MPLTIKNGWLRYRSTKTYDEEWAAPVNEVKSLNHDSSVEGVWITVGNATFGAHDHTVEEVLNLIWSETAHGNFEVIANQAKIIETLQQQLEELERGLS